ncbi:hypothetical protein SCLCIDRAFT_963505 [Scleroderma citrinum Foug A]|uniref:Uncharacterized protein n=1 Tax=Scleroderma citrinum Foug A TaxID=1036808 RepID=A0A0C2ZES3_9AGAM|nr:hypothetical protein SCLCIDRAFT_963505 [Scleroderma citrinum Foug A]
MLLTYWRRRQWTRVCRTLCTYVHHLDFQHRYIGEVLPQLIKQDYHDVTLYYCLRTCGFVQSKNISIGRLRSEIYVFACVHHILSVPFMRMVSPREWVNFPVE